MTARTTTDGAVTLGDTAHARIAEAIDAACTDALRHVLAELDEARQFARHYRARAGATSERLPWESRTADPLRPTTTTTKGTP